MSAGRPRQSDLSLERLALVRVHCVASMLGDRAVYGPGARESKRVPDLAVGWEICGRSATRRASARRRVRLIALADVPGSGESPWRERWGRAA